MKINQSLLVLLFAFVFGNLSAHNLWIETSYTGKKGKEHIAKIYLGGYGENERDSVGKWFSNTRDVAIWLTEPGGGRKQLSTKPASDFLEARFVPAKEGVYTLTISHEVADIYGTSKIQYHAAAQVHVGVSVEGGNHLASATDLPIQVMEGASGNKKPVSIKVMFKGNNLDKTTVSVASPAGWTKSFETRNGTIAFEPLWPGLYVIEAYYTEKSEGSHNGKEYKVIKHTATYSVAFNK